MELVVLRREVYQVQADRAELKAKHHAELEKKNVLIGGLKSEITRLKRERRFSAPGDLKESRA